MKYNNLRRCKYHVVGWSKDYFVEKYSDSSKRLSETDIIQIFELLLDNYLKDIIYIAEREFKKLV
jgi:hypothetical protein